MRIIRQPELTPTPWKNGGGVTREIAAHRNGAALVWRLSMADVASDGPFSIFAGMIRVLTVIEGNGMELICPSETLYADFGEPVRFDGGLKINARLFDGPLRDLNLIFDPLLCDGQVVSINGPHRQALRASAGLIFAVHGLSGEVVMDQRDHLFPGDTALVETGNVQMDLAKGAAALLVRLKLLGQTDASKAATAAR
jgi:uncharacterized protein